MRYRQSIKIEKPKKSRWHFQSSNHGGKHRKQQTTCKFVIVSAKGKISTKVREASDVNNTSRSSMVGDEVHVRFAAPGHTLSVQPTGSLHDLIT